MRRFTIVGKNKDNVKALQQHFLHHQFIHDPKKPEFVVSLGGDGTYLYAERLYPGIPKLLIRDSKVCNKCDENSMDKVIQALKSGQYTIRECLKLDALVNGKHRLTAANDIVVRNKHLTHAIRFNLEIDRKQIGGEFIGDGLVIATPYGSTAYYYSITKQSFASGIGIGLNNITRRMRSLRVSENARIKITMTREEAQLAADNCQDVVMIKTGDVIGVRKHKECAKIITVNIGLTEWLKRFQFLGRRRSI